MKCLEKKKKKKRQYYVLATYYSKLKWVISKFCCFLGRAHV